MTFSIETTLKELSAFGLNPAQWLIGQVIIQKGKPAILFESREDRSLKLVGWLKNGKNRVGIQSLEWVAF